MSDVAWSRGGAGEDGRHIITACDDANLYLCRVSDGKRVCDFKGHMKEVFCCAYSPQGGLAASGSEDETIRLWDPQSAACIRTIPAHCDPVTSVDFSNNGECLCSGSYDGTVRLWNTRNGEVLVTFTAKLPVAPPVGCARFTPNSKYIAVTYLQSFAMLVEIGTLATGLSNQQKRNNHQEQQKNSHGSDEATNQLKAMRKFHGHSNDDFASFLAFPHLPRQHGGRGLLVGSEDGRPCLYEIQSAKVVQRLGPKFSASTSNQTPEGAAAASGKPEDAGGAKEAQKGNGKSHSEAVIAVDAHPYKPLCVTGAMEPDSSVKLWAPPSKNYQAKQQNQQQQQ